MLLQYLLRVFKVIDLKNDENYNCIYYAIYLLSVNNLLKNSHANADLVVILEMYLLGVETRPQTCPSTKQDSDTF